MPSEKCRGGWARSGGNEEIYIYKERNRGRNTK
jgi:hypothetical protein